MRIIKEINKGLLKITVFKYQDKLSIKFEKDLNEILIKFRDGGLEDRGGRGRLGVTESAGSSAWAGR